MALRRRILALVVVLFVGAGLTAGVVAYVASGIGRGTPAASPERVAIPEVARRTPPPPPSLPPTGGSAAPGDGCAATVDGGDAAAVEQAAAAAGAGTVCFPAGTYEGPFTASVAGQTWRLDDEAVLAGHIAIKAPDVWISGGTVELPAEDPFSEGVIVDADRATIEDVTFHGGGLVISVKGRDGTQVLDNSFSGQSGTSVFVWGEGRGSDDTLIEGNTIDQSAGRDASPIASRASEDEAEGVVNRRITIRGNTIDQGDETTGHFGVELKLSPEAVIVDNEIRGGKALVSLPDSDNVIVSGNRLDLVGSPVWAIEIANSDDVTVEDNTIVGDGPDSGDVAVSMNSGSMRALITANAVRSVRTLVNLTGDDHRIVDNCLVNVRDILAYRTSAGPNVDAERNGACG
jgi:Right handed beta helix region